MLAPAQATWSAEADPQAVEAKDAQAALPFLATLLVILLSPLLFDLTQRLMAALHGS